MTSGVLLLQVDDAPTAEWSAARSWLEEEYSGRTARLHELPEALAARPDAVWLHTGEPVGFPDPAERALRAYMRGGGGLLATGAGATLPATLGWEPWGPNERTAASWSDDADDLAFHTRFSRYPRIRGLQSFRGHPLFDGLGSGTYTWAPRDGERYVRWAYTGDTWPERARVIAVEKAYIHVNPDRRLAWELEVGDGHVLCIGGYVCFAASDDRYRPHLERLISNALGRIGSHAARDPRGGIWRPLQTGLTYDKDLPAAPGLAGAPGPVPDRPVTSRAAADAPYTLAGDRTLLVGHETAGHQEIWFHPIRAAHRCTLALEAEGDPSGLELGAESIVVGPGWLRRRLTAGDALIDERTIVAPDAPGLLVELELGDGDPLHLIWTWETDLRLMWPYPAGATGPLKHGLDVGAVTVQAATGEALGLRIEPPPTVLSVSNASDAERSAVRVRAEFELRDRVRILLVGAGRDERLPARVDPADWTRSLESRVERSDAGVALDVGAPELEEALDWANWRLGSYRLRVPKLGVSLAAAHGGSEPGGFSDGRPGYAWYFGRDAVWTALAGLAAGRFAEAREVLEFLGAHQDVTGKILHECTTSGVVHYDAADATPLYLLLAARYLAWTGDADGVRTQWPRIVKAYEFCLRTDSDGDGLIENTHVGHGWIEFGRLGGSHVSFYLAGVWAAALRELSEAAAHLGAPTDELAARAEAARAALELGFYDPVAGRYALGRDADGTLRMDETVMTAVPLLLGVATPERCAGWLDRVDSPDFTAPWGVRLVPRSDPEYAPDGYHAGAVWPLFTGWTSLAEYRAGRTEAAYRHWRQVADLCGAAAAGAWPEVLHGEERRSIGVTHDQAWSTAMAVWPLIEGMFGARPDAPASRIELTPRPPAEWDRGALTDLRVGDTRLHIEWARDGDRTAYTIDASGPELEVRWRRGGPGPEPRIVFRVGDGLPARELTGSSSR